MTYRYDGPLGAVVGELDAGPVGGHIHLAMAPMWFAAALALEPLHDMLVS
jgi:hypothetical protein